MGGLDFTQISIQFVILVGSLTVHEAAHAWVANALGDPTARMLGRLSLNPVVHIDPIGTIVFPLIAMLTGVPLIGWAKPVPVDTRHLRSPRTDFALIAAAGPSSNIVLALGAAGIFTAIGGRVAFEAGSALAFGLLLAIILNVLLAVFNMIPVPPLDGGNVLMGLLPASAAGAIDRLRPYGFMLIYLLMFSGVLSAIVRPVQRTVLGWLL